MGRFLPTRDMINQRWFDRWGETFGTAELSHYMMSNERIFERCRDRMLTAFGIDLKADIKQEDVWAAKAYGENRTRLARICGMVIHGEYLRSCISKEDYATISSVFSVEDLKIAVSLNHLHPPRSEFVADVSKIETLIERSGNACIHAWKSGLDKEIGMRVYLMESDEELEAEVTHTMKTAQANAIMTAVSLSLLNEHNNENSETSLQAA